MLPSYMKFSVIICYIIFLLSIKLLCTNSCWNKKSSPTTIANQQLISFTGAEFDPYMHIENYIAKNFAKPDLFSNAPAHSRMILQRTDKIKIDIFAKLTEDRTHMELFRIVEIIFSDAKKHLHENFLLKLYDSKTYKRIMVCCIEFSLELHSLKIKNTQHNGLSSCLSILGIDSSPKDYSYLANIWEDDLVLEIII